LRVISPEQGTRTALAAATGQLFLITTAVDPAGRAGLRPDPEYALATRCHSELG